MLAGAVRELTHRGWEVTLVARPRGLPLPVSGHNTYWLWGPPDADGPTIAVGPEREHLDRLFADCEQAAQVTNPHQVSNDELGAPVWVCRDQRAPWPDLWQLTRHYG